MDEVPPPPRAPRFVHVCLGPFQGRGILVSHRCAISLSCAVCDRAVCLAPCATEPAWKTIPSWFVYGDHDTAIPPKLHAFLAERARARATSVVDGASHIVMISHPEAVAKVIEDAATAR